MTWSLWVYQSPVFLLMSPGIYFNFYWCLSIETCVVELRYALAPCFLNIDHQPINVSEWTGSINHTNGWCREALNKQRNERHDPHRVRVTWKEAFRKTLACELAVLSSAWALISSVCLLDGWPTERTKKMIRNPSTLRQLYFGRKILGPSSKQNGHWVNKDVVFNALLFHFCSVVWSWVLLIKDVVVGPQAGPVENRCRREKSDFDL